MSGGRFFVAESHTIMCKEPAPKAAIINIQWA